MLIMRFLVLLFNIGVITFLIYRMFAIARQPMRKMKKAVILTAGILLLIVPLSFFMRIIPPTTSYFLAYPVAVSFFFYMIKEE